MRWMDLPPDPGPADGRASVLPRGEWEALKRRLERLPEGHPSRPDDAAGTAADEESAAEDLADGGNDPPGQPEPAEPGDGKPADPQRPVRGPHGADVGRAKPGGPGGHGDVGGRGEREPYRPWFTGGESPEPWFVVGPD